MFVYWRFVGVGALPWQSLDILFALPVFALVLFRLAGLMMTAPLLSSSSMPIRVRIGFVVGCAVVIFPLVSVHVPARLELVDVVVGGVRELTIGACMGLAVATMMSGVEIGGLMIGQQAGIALGQVFNPVQDRQTSIVGQIYSIVLILIFLSVGGHRAMLSALLDSFEVIPMWSSVRSAPPALLIAEMLASSLILAVRLAGPVLAAVFMASIAMGFLSRTMPQLNILSVGFQARILIGMGAAAIALLSARDLFLGAIWDGIAMIRDHYGLDAVGRMAGA